MLTRCQFAHHLILPEITWIIGTSPTITKTGIVIPAHDRRYVAQQMYGNPEKYFLKAIYGQPVERKFVKWFS
jgi:hypothetical protein